MPNPSRNRHLLAVATLLFSLTGCHDDLSEPPVHPLPALEDVPAKEGYPEGEPGQRYTLTASLDPETHRVTGEVHIAFENSSRVPLDALWFHTYLNAFESENTVFYQESGGKLRQDEASGAGRIELNSVEVKRSADCASTTATPGDTLKEGAPGDTRGADTAPPAKVGTRERLQEVVYTRAPEDRSEFKLPLDCPLAPGATAEVRVEFRAELPPLFARSGYLESFHVIAQWFPKLAKIDADGFVHFPYHGNGEFYADFANYTATLTAPVDFMVAATGVPDEAIEQDGLRTQTFRARWVHDFVWVAYDHFTQKTTTIDDHELVMYAPVGYEKARDAQITALEDALPRMEREFGDYPHPRLTVVIPPRAATGGAGMEYPTLFMSAGGHTEARMPRAFGGMATCLHELAHQWFQGMVATNEVRWPMLDESLTSWATSDLLHARFGRASSGLVTPFHSSNAFDVMRVFGMRHDDGPPPDRHVSEFKDSSYGRVIYAKAPALFETIARTWGRTRLRRAIGDYARQYRFKHPTPTDLYAVLDAHYWPGFSAQVVRPGLSRGIPAELTLETVAYDADRKTLHVVAQRNTQGPAIPTHVAVTLDNGETKRFSFPGTEATFDREITLNRPPTIVAVDPDGAVLFEKTKQDNLHAFTRPPRTKANVLRALANFLLRPLGT